MTSDILPDTVSVDFLEPVHAGNATAISLALAGLPADTEVPNLEKLLTQIGKQARKDIEKIIETLPDSYSLVPVAYHRISPQHNKVLWREFLGKAEPGLLRNLAIKHEFNLLQRGFDAHALHEMRLGRYPVNHEGKMFNISPDHILERAGSGALSTTRKQENLWHSFPETGNSLYAVNSEDNIDWMPQWLHDIKNRIIQYYIPNGQMKPGKTRFVLLLVRNEPLPSDLGAIKDEAPDTGVFRGYAESHFYRAWRNIRKLTTLIETAQSVNADLLNPDILRAWIRDQAEIRQAIWHSVAESHNLAVTAGRWAFHATHDVDGSQRQIVRQRLETMLKTLRQCCDDIPDLSANGSMHDHLDIIESHVKRVLNAQHNPYQHGVKPPRLQNC